MKLLLWLSERSMALLQVSIFAYEYLIKPLWAHVYDFYAASVLRKARRRY